MKLVHQESDKEWTQCGVSFGKMFATRDHRMTMLQSSSETTMPYLSVLHLLIACPNATEFGGIAPGYLLFVGSSWMLDKCGPNWIFTATLREANHPWTDSVLTGTEIDIGITHGEPREFRDLLPTPSKFAAD